jgi:hypothetical protein
VRPRYFRHARQKIGGNWRKQGDEPRDENSLCPMAFEKSLGPL